MTQQQSLRVGKLFIHSAYPNFCNSSLQHPVDVAEHIDTNVAWNSLRPGYTSSSISEVKKTAVAKFNASIPSMKKHSMQGTCTRYSSSCTSTRMQSFSSSGLQNGSTSGRPTHKESESDTASNFQPFSLLYNECSLTAISNWASRGGKNNIDESNEQNTADSRTFHRPVASPMFRRCVHCNDWGHYDTECTKLCEKDAIQLAASTRTQRNLCQFVQDANTSNARRTVHDQKKFLGRSSILQLGADEQRAASGGGAGTGTCNIIAQQNQPFRRTNEEEEEYLIRTNACEVCNSGFNADDLLLCDGCDCLFHIQCLDPPLKRIPEGDWFCDKCNAYDSDVSSVVELEGCDVFVFEQRRRSGKSKRP